MSNATTEPAELLVQVILDADFLTDEQKELYVSELLEGRIHPELAANLDTIIDRSIQSATQDAESIQAQMSAIDSALARAEDEEGQANAVTLQKYEAAIGTIVSEHAQECTTIEREYDQGMEKAADEFRNKPEQDAIRQYLQEGDQGQTQA